MELSWAVNCLRSQRNSGIEKTGVSKSKNKLWEDFISSFPFHPPFLVATKRLNLCMLSSGKEKQIKCRVYCWFGNYWMTFWAFCLLKQKGMICICTIKGFSIGEGRLLNDQPAVTKFFKEVFSGKWSWSNYDEISNGLLAILYKACSQNFT